MIAAKNFPDEMIDALQKAFWKHYADASPPLKQILHTAFCQGVRWALEYRELTAKDGTSLPPAVIEIDPERS